MTGSPAAPVSAKDQPENYRFRTTNWTRVGDAADSQGTGFSDALETLCQDYWYPLYSYVRRSGYSAEEAKDYTQDFFERMLSKDFFKRADRDRGRFRSFLVGCLKRFLMEKRRNSGRIKRGGHAVHGAPGRGGCRRRLFQ